MDVAVAPVLISVYDRLEHFASCMESLAKCERADETEVYISSDGARDADSAKRVDAVRRCVRELRGFRRVELVAPSTNTGGRIKQEVRSRILSQYDRLISAEDDNVFGRSFLAFVNEALEQYQDDGSVRAVCGHLPIGVSLRSREEFRLRYFSAHGYGVWRRKEIARPYVQYGPVSAARAILDDCRLVRRINLVSPRTTANIRSTAQGLLIASDGLRLAEMIKAEQVAVFPGSNLVQNTGYDGTGLHCGIDSKMSGYLASDEGIIVRAGPRGVLDSLAQQQLYGYLGGRPASVRAHIDHLRHEHGRGVRVLVDSLLALRRIFRCSRPD